jgi:hypothetical protein
VIVDVDLRRLDALAGLPERREERASNCSTAPGEAC